MFSPPAFSSLAQIQMASFAHFATHWSVSQVPIDQIGIQFIQFGNDPDGTAALNVLDNELKEWDSVQKLHRYVLITAKSFTGINNRGGIL